MGVAAKGGRWRSSAALPGAFLHPRRLAGPHTDPSAGLTGRHLILPSPLSGHSYSRRNVALAGTSHVGPPGLEPGTNRL
jgi:hypothetical protein